MTVVGLLRLHGGVNDTLRILYHELPYRASCPADAQDPIVGQRSCWTRKTQEIGRIMPSIESVLTIMEVNGPFREPREEVFSYDYSIQRSTWMTPHGVRVKVSIPDELETFKRRLLGVVAGSPGQQLLMSNILSRAIADWKIRVADEEGLLTERRDVMLGPFIGPLSHLFVKLEALFEAARAPVREEVKRRVGL